MRVIWVTPALPHPEAAGGWSNEYELIRALADRHDIEVVSSDLEDPLDPGVFAEIGVGFTRVPWHNRTYPVTTAGVTRGLVRAIPNLTVWLRRDRLPALAAAVAEKSTRARPDVVHITLGELAPLVAEMAAPTALLLYDSLTREIEGRLARETRLRRQAQLRLERWRTERFERHWYSRATTLASVSTVDAEWFEEHVGRPVEIIENSVPDRLFDAPDRPRSADVVTFVGSLNHHPNRDAIEWLVEEIWPAVVAQRPQAELRIVGRSDPGGVVAATVRRLVASVGGRLDLDVADIRPSYWDAAVVVAPIRLGGGVRSKVIHAMACAAPVVATPPAMEGVPESAARHALVGTAGRELADALVATLADPTGARERAAKAVQGIQALRSSAVAERLEAWWDRAASTRSR